MERLGMDSHINLVSFRARKSCDYSGIKNIYLRHKLRKCFCVTPAILTQDKFYWTWFLKSGIFNLLADNFSVKRFYTDQSKIKLFKRNGVKIRQYSKWLRWRMKLIKNSNPIQSICCKGINRRFSAYKGYPATDWRRKLANPSPTAPTPIIKTFNMIRLSI